MNKKTIIIIILVIGIAAAIFSSGIVQNYMREASNRKEGEKNLAELRRQEEYSDDIAIGLVNSVYEKEGKNYIDIDYVVIQTCGDDMQENSCAFESRLVNNNPKIRTFEVSPDAQFLRTDPVEVLTFEVFKNMTKERTWNITIKDGVVTEMVEN